MTEQEWLECEDPKRMLRFVQSTTSDRQLRLFICACCRLIWSQLRDERSKESVEVGERYADGLIDTKAREEALNAAGRPMTTIQRYNRKHHRYLMTRGLRAAIVARLPCWLGERLIGCVDVCVDEALALMAPADAPRFGVLVRDIVGNPFRPSPFREGSWLTPTVTSLAVGAYEERILPSGELDPARIAVLSDALEEAGCMGDILDHLRSPTPHTRGCWPLDLCLGLQ